MIRVAITQDLSTVVALAHRIWPAVYSSIFTAEQCADALRQVYSAERLAQEMADGHRFWLAHADGWPVAYASACLHDDIIWLKKLYVAPLHHRKGIGTALMRAAVASFSPAKEMRVQVYRDNIAAQQYYTHHGFHGAGETEVYTGDRILVNLVFARPL